MVVRNILLCGRQTLNVPQTRLFITEIETDVAWQSVNGFFAIMFWLVNALVGTQHQMMDWS